MFHGIMNNPVFTYLMVTRQKPSMIHLIGPNCTVFYYIKLWIIL